MEQLGLAMLNGLGVLHMPHTTRKNLLLQEGVLVLVMPVPPQQPALGQCADSMSFDEPVSPRGQSPTTSTTPRAVHACQAEATTPRGTDGFGNGRRTRQKTV
eukprot:m51a1_g12721 hypothetical protein (102) ;mRNA; r:713-1140